MVVHAYNSNPWEVEARGLGVQGQPGLDSEFKTTMEYKGRPCLKNNFLTFKTFQKFYNPIFGLFFIS
jgi:hypothetical protein